MGRSGETERAHVGVRSTFCPVALVAKQAAASRQPIRSAETQPDQAIRSPVTVLGAGRALDTRSHRLSEALGAWHLDVSIRDVRTKMCKCMCVYARRGTLVMWPTQCAGATLRGGAVPRPQPTARSRKEEEGSAGRSCYTASPTAFVLSARPYPELRLARAQSAKNPFDPGVLRA